MTDTKSPEQLVFVQLFHPDPTKNRSDWPVKRQWVCTRDEYLALPPAEQKDTKVTFVSATQAAIKKQFDRSAEFVPKAEPKPEPKPKPKPKPVAEEPAPKTKRKRKVTRKKVIE